MPTISNLEKFESDNFLDNFDDEFKKVWFESDARIFNLECPLGSGNKIKKSGPHLNASKLCINGIKALDPSLILLANNHILDYGIDGVNSTLEVLENAKINYTGIIDNVDSEYEPFYLKGDKIVGIYNVCDNEFTQATDSLGANGLNDLKTYLEIKEAKTKCDYLIVIFHGGKEFYRYPSPNLQKICRNFTLVGADLVITQHSHCIGTYEEYGKSTIVYGQGNFIFDNIDDEYWNTGMLISIDISDNINIEYIPIERKNTLIQIGNSKILDGFYKRHDEIKDSKFLNKKFNEFAKENFQKYMRLYANQTIYNRILNKLKKDYYINYYSESSYLSILNSIRSEAHREVLIAGILEYLKEHNHE